MEALQDALTAVGRKCLRTWVRYFKVHDAETGLLIRPSFDRRARRFLERASGVPALMVVNLDHVAEMNYRMGFAACDKFLLDLARLLPVAAPTSLVGRRSRAEYTLLVPADVDPVELAQNIRAEVARIPTADSTRLTVSVGISRRQARDLDEHLALAAEARVQAANKGRDRLEVLR